MRPRSPVSLPAGPLGGGLVHDLSCVASILLVELQESKVRGSVATAGSAEHTLGQGPPHLPWDEPWAPAVLPGMLGNVSAPPGQWCLSPRASTPGPLPSPPPPTGWAPGGPALGPQWASGPRAASWSRCGGWRWAGWAPPRPVSPQPQPAGSAASAAPRAAHAPPPASSPAPGPAPAAPYSSSAGWASPQGEGTAQEQRGAERDRKGVGRAATWVSISCFFSLMRERPEKSMVSAGRAGWVSVCVPSPPPPHPMGMPVPTSVFDLLLARLGGGHHVGGHLIDGARALLQATQVGAVLVGLHLGAWVARGRLRDGPTACTTAPRSPSRGGRGASPWRPPPAGPCWLRSRASRR